MRISDLGEFGLIERIRRSFGTSSKKAPIGIGDDAAALCVSPGRLLLATTDMLVEGVHFDLSTTDLASLGWKSAAVNLSDIAAMGGTPRSCLVALAIPRRIAVEGITEFYRGLNGLLGKHHVALVGGDTCGSKTDLIISITMLGEVPQKQVLARSGAQPGDLIYVTGALGDSAAGLELLRSKKKKGDQRTDIQMLVERHVRPVPRVDWGRKLALSGCVSAMIDVSDGLSSDLGHLCEESGVGADIYKERIPLSRSLQGAQGLTRDAVDYALSGGEDYELLFTVPPVRERKLLKLRIDATKIGVVTKGRALRLMNEQGRSRPLRASGYDHFRTAGRGTGK